MPGFKKPSLRVRRSRWRSQRLEPVTAYALCATCREPVMLQNVCRSKKCNTDWLDTKKSYWGEKVALKVKRKAEIKEVIKEIKKTLQ